MLSKIKLKYALLLLCIFLFAGCYQYGYYPYITGEHSFYGKVIPVHNIGEYRIYPHVIAERTGDSVGNSSYYRIFGTIKSDYYLKRYDAFALKGASELTLESLSIKYPIR
jgi:hypothetical protein